MRRQQPSDEARALMATVNQHQTELDGAYLPGDLRELALLRDPLRGVSPPPRRTLSLVLENTNVKAQRLAFRARYRGG